MGLRFFVLARVLLFVISVAANAAGGVPRFEDHAIELPLFSLRRVDLDSHPRARKFRTVLRAAAERGPNFAGKYAVARWGCGTGCIEWAVINLETGRVYFEERFSPVAWMVGWGDEPDDFLEFRSESALMIVNGAVEDSASEVLPRHYLRWTGESFELLAVENLALKRID